MATAPYTRATLTMPEVATQLGWSEQHVREALITGAITPSYFVNKAVWVYDVGETGALTKRTPAISLRRWLYAVRFKQTAAWDGHFEYLAETPQPIVPGSILYRLDGNSMVKGHVLPLAEVLAHGGVMTVELNRFISSVTDTPQTLPPGTVEGERPKWWNTDYNILEMADAEKSRRTTARFGANQSGPRAGKQALSGIANAVATKVCAAETAAGRSRPIGAKTINNYLRAKGWDQGN